MKFKPIHWFYIIVVFLCLLDLALWYQHRTVWKEIHSISGIKRQVTGMYRSKPVSPLAAKLEQQIKQTEERISQLAEPFPIKNLKWNKILFSFLLYFAVPVVSIYLLWKYYRYKKSE